LELLPIVAAAAAGHKGGLTDAYSRLGDQDAARRHCDTSLELRPGFAPAETLRARIAGK
jgi:hypothetical protein